MSLIGISESQGSRRRRLSTHSRVELARTAAAHLVVGATKERRGLAGGARSARGHGDRRGPAARGAALEAGTSQAQVCALVGAGAALLTRDGSSAAAAVTAGWGSGAGGSRAAGLGRSRAGAVSTTSRGGRGSGAGLRGGDEDTTRDGAVRISAGSRGGAGLLVSYGNNRRDELHTGSGWGSLGSWNSRGLDEGCDEGGGRY